MSERSRLISAERSIIWAADLEPKRYQEIISAVGETGLGAVKIGFQVGLGLGLPRAVRLAREADPSIKIIYDHQKAGNDIPDTAVNFAQTMSDAEVDAAILFPFTGRDVQEAWTYELQQRDIGVIVGAEMTHPGISDRIRDDAFEEMFDQAIEQQVTDFVVPGNKPASVARWKSHFDTWLGVNNFDLYSPGFIDQGGSVSESGLAAGRYFHPIVGRGISKSDDPGGAVQELREEL